MTGPAGAGALLIGSIVTGALTGLGIGALAGVPAVLAFVGGVLGAVGGFWLVYQRFKDI